MKNIKRKHLKLRNLLKKRDENLFDYFYNPPGSVPGTLRIEADAAPPEIELIDYDVDKVVRLANLTPQECKNHLETESVSWVDVSGLGNKELLQELGIVFNLHPLILEDIVNVPQRPKIETYPNQLVIITQMVMLKEQEKGFHLEQVSLVLGKEFLLSVQEEPELDCLDPVRNRIEYNKGRIRHKDADYLAYALWDAIVDGFFPVLEVYGERIADLEDELISDPTNESLGEIYQIRRELLALRRAIWPQREAMNILLRGESPLFGADAQIYLRDCYSHTIQIIDIIETYRELASGLMDVYLSAVSNKMNEIMKLLTIISTIFIPLTFIVGVYGMNFNPETSAMNMPELNWAWGYPVVWLVMILITVVLVYFFWRQGWFKNIGASKRI